VIGTPYCIRYGYSRDLLIRDPALILVESTDALTGSVRATFVLRPNLPIDIVNTNCTIE